MLKISAEGFDINSVMIKHLKQIVPTNNGLIPCTRKNFPFQSFNALLIARN